MDIGFQIWAVRSCLAPCAVMNILCCRARVSCCMGRHGSGTSIWTRRRQLLQGVLLYLVQEVQSRHHVFVFKMPASGTPETPSLFLRRVPATGKRLEGTGWEVPNKGWWGKLIATRACMHAHNNSKHVRRAPTSGAKSACGKASPKPIASAVVLLKTLPASRRQTCGAWSSAARSLAISLAVGRGAQTKSCKGLARRAPVVQRLVGVEEAGPPPSVVRREMLTQSMARNRLRMHPLIIVHKLLRTLLMCMRADQCRQALRGGLRAHDPSGPSARGSARARRSGRG